MKQANEGNFTMKTHEVLTMWYLVVGVIFDSININTNFPIQKERKEKKRTH